MLSTVVNLVLNTCLVFLVITCILARSSRKRLCSRRQFKANSEVVSIKNEQPLDATVEFQFSKVGRSSMAVQNL